MDATIFGIKPKMIVKGGFIAYALMGDPNASIPTTEPVYYRPMFGALGKQNNQHPLHSHHNLHWMMDYRKN